MYVSSLNNNVIMPTLSPTFAINNYFLLVVMQILLSGEYELNYMQTVCHAKHIE